MHIATYHPDHVGGADPSSLVGNGPCICIELYSGLVFLWFRLWFYLWKFNGTQRHERHRGFISCDAQLLLTVPICCVCASLYLCLSLVASLYLCLSRCFSLLSFYSLLALNLAGALPSVIGGVQCRQ